MGGTEHYLSFLPLFALGIELRPWLEIAAASGFASGLGRGAALAGSSKGLAASGSAALFPMAAA